MNPFEWDTNLSLIWGVAKKFRVPDLRTKTDENHLVTFFHSCTPPSCISLVTKRSLLYWLNGNNASYQTVYFYNSCRIYRHTCFLKPLADLNLQIYSVRPRPAPAQFTFLLLEPWHPSLFFLLLSPKKQWYEQKFGHLKMLKIVGERLLVRNIIRLVWIFGW